MTNGIVSQQRNLHAVTCYASQEFQFHLEISDGDVLEEAPFNRDKHVWIGWNFQPNEGIVRSHFNFGSNQDNTITQTLCKSDYFFFSCLTKNFGSSDWESIKFKWLRTTAAGDSLKRNADKNNYRDNSRSTQTGRRHALQRNTFQTQSVNWLSVVFLLGFSFWLLYFLQCIWQYPLEWSLEWSLKCHRDFDDEWKEVRWKWDSCETRRVICKCDAFCATTIIAHESWWFQCIMIMWLSFHAEWGRTWQIIASSSLRALIVSLTLRLDLKIVLHP